jgi:hypothetical protein
LLESQSGDDDTKAVPILRRDSLYPTHLTSKKGGFQVPLTLYQKNIKKSFLTDKLFSSTIFYRCQVVTGWIQTHDLKIRSLVFYCYATTARHHFYLISVKLNEKAGWI